ncbi:hypothetical protein D0T49_04230 [Paludibacter sp. 221]|uniref:hypothetical protein n=1 Tax=Paludibacter sp. 221 TaxID=2302939 RepID=UPI0013D8A618|nr:hypothetical protein [Paludibacter sp. 221]NDV46247.1 hypothetical protein [Paludibacter sp. 221]
MGQVIKKFEVNELTEEMILFYEENKDRVNPVTGEKEIIKIFNEGSSRSGKTFSAFDFITYLCDKQEHREKPLSIYVIRKTLKSCRERSYHEDFVGHAKNIGTYSREYAFGERTSPEFNLFGSKVKFIGLDNDEELGRSDILFFNEALDNDDEKLINRMLMRCEVAAIFDWNPKYTEHFLFDREGQFNTLFTKTTFLNNRFLKQKVKAGLLAKCPWSFDDFDFDSKTWKKPKNPDREKYKLDNIGKWTQKELDEYRAPNIYNIQTKTADEHEWMVYGEGERHPEEGSVLEAYEWIDKYPDEAMDETAYGLDLGFTVDPSVLTRVGRKGMDLYIEYLTYQPCPSADILFDLIEPIILAEQERLKKYTLNGEIEDIIISSESNDRYRDENYIVSMNSSICVKGYEGWGFVKIKKPSIVSRISLCKRFRLHVVKNKKAENEFNNYVYQVIEGRKTNIPIGRHNHGIDSFGYAVWHRFAYIVEAMNADKQ